MASPLFYFSSFEKKAHFTLSEQAVLLHIPPVNHCFYFYTDAFSFGSPVIMHTMPEYGITEFGIRKRIRRTIEIQLLSIST